jgi:internalin A
MRCPRLSGVALKHLAAIPTLRIAILDCSGLRDADLGELKRSPIEALTLNRASFSGAALTALQGMPNLIELGIYDIDLGNDGAAVLHGFDRLRRLTLGGERITDGGLKPLTGLRVLRELDLVDTTLTEAGLEAIKRALPKAQITLRRSKPGER